MDRGEGVWGRGKGREEGEGKGGWGREEVQTEGKEGGVVRGEVWERGEEQKKNKSCI